MARRRFTDEEEQEIARLYLAGHSARALSKLYNLPGKDAILGALCRTGTTQRSPSDRNRLYTLDNTVFDEINEASAYWWGFLYADGCLSRRSLTVALAAKDADHLQKLCNFMESDRPVKIYDNYVNDIKYKRCDVNFTDQHLAYRLQELGVTPRRQNFQISNSILPIAYQCDWIRGLFDGDGSVDFHKNGQPRFRLCGQEESMVWVKGVLGLIVSSGVGSIKKHSISNIFYLEYSGRKMVSDITHYLYDGTTLFMQRKYERAIKSWVEPIQRERDRKGRYL